MYNRYATQHCNGKNCHLIINYLNTFSLHTCISNMNECVDVSFGVRTERKKRIDVM